MKATLYTRFFYLIFLCLLAGVGARAQFGSDLGADAVSTLAWDHISSVYSSSSYTGAETDGSIGLTTDKRMYVWGTNLRYTIHTNYWKNSAATNFIPLAQTTPFYLPSPVGETIKKVQVKNSLHPTAGAGNTFFALSESGKLYAWGFNNGLLATAWPVPTSPMASTFPDTAQTKRTPVQLTILTESTFVDFDVSSFGNYWIAIGASGKAYHIGANGVVSGGGDNTQYTFAALPNPAGVDAATFKYTNVWVYKLNSSLMAMAYLKGNNGKLYYTGLFATAYASGVPSLFARNSPAPTLNTAEGQGNIRTMVPREVPLPTGADIVKMEIGYVRLDRQTTYAISADGKAYMTGLWKAIPKVDEQNGKNYVVVPLKTAPQSTEVEVLYRNADQDTTYTLKNFVEVAMPPGATKILDIMSHDKLSASGGYYGSSVVGDNNRVYWSGTLVSSGYFTPLASNYLSLSSPPTQDQRCNNVIYATTTTPYTWSQESINLKGASELFSTVAENGTNPQIGIISKTGRGYFLGTMSASAGTGKNAIAFTTWEFMHFPVPIANEQLLSCQTSPGTGGPLTGPITPTNTAVGTIDCSKTKIAPAPVAGVPSQTTLIVSVNVTTAGTFTPITVSGSGMSLGNGITSVSTTSTGVQTFYIPLQYDGTALTNAFQFTVGSAGSCSADLTQKSNQQITNVWSLNNCTAITPGTLSKQ